MLPDFDFYKTKYRKGYTPIISEEAFPFLIEIAWDELNAYNFYAVEFDELPDIVKRLLCEIAEFIWVNVENAPTAGQIISESNFQTSWRALEPKAADDINKQIRNLIKRRLAKADSDIFNTFVSGGF